RFSRPDRRGFDVPASELMLNFAEVLREVFVAPLASAEALSFTTMVTISPTSLARRSRVESASRAPAKYNDPEDGCAHASAGIASPFRIFFFCPEPFLPPPRAPGGGVRFRDCAHLPPRRCVPWIRLPLRT